VTDTQLYLVVGLPVFAVLTGFWGSAWQVNTIHARLISFEMAMNARFTSLEVRFTSLESRFDTLVEALLERH